MSQREHTSTLVHFEYELVGRQVEAGEVAISPAMAACVRDYVSQEFLPQIDTARVTELDDDHDLTEARKGYSYLGTDGRMHRYFAGLALHHGLDTWTLGVLTTDSLTGQIQHRKMKLYRFVVSAGQVLEAYVQKKFIIDMLDLSADGVLRGDHDVLKRRAVEMPLTEPGCWRLIEELDTLLKQSEPEKYLGIPVRLYPS
jgi:hypothetical protein